MDHAQACLSDPKSAGRTLKAADQRFRRFLPRPPARDKAHFRPLEICAQRPEAIVVSAALEIAFVRRPRAARGLFADVNLTRD